MSNTLQETATIAPSIKDTITTVFAQVLQITDIITSAYNMQIETASYLASSFEDQQDLFIHQSLHTVLCRSKDKVLNDFNSHFHNALKTRARPESAYSFMLA